MQRSQNLVFRISLLNEHKKKLLRNLIVCYKNVSNPSCVGLVITNNSSSLQNTKTVSAGLLDFHKMVSIVLKQTFQRSSPKEHVCRN